MTYNIVAYIISAIISVFIIYNVGNAFHRNGRVFILRLFKNNEVLTDTTNNLLLLAYYLFNIGYAIVQFRFWEPVPNAQVLINSIAQKNGMLILILAVTHYFNMTLIYYFSKTINKTITTKM